MSQPRWTVEDRSPTARCSGQLGQPIAINEMARRTWDAIIVGAGHNGLTCAAYLAREQCKVLVLEARDRVGGACTAREIWPGYHLSPCAYLAGLLHEQVIVELSLRRRGFRWHPARAGMFVPFLDGESLQLWDDPHRCEEEIRRISPGDVKGWKAFQAVKSRLRARLRPPGSEDLWLEPEPTLEQVEDRLGRDEEARQVLWHWSMAEMLEYYLNSERLHEALLGQGVIGTNASPFDPGTASIHFHHASGRIDRQPGTWGYVEGGMGVVSFLICDAAREAGAVIATEVPVAEIEPGLGVRLDDGTRIEAPVVVCNADPRRALAMLGDQVDPAWRERIEAIPIQGCTLKLNVALTDLPSFGTRPGRDCDHHSGQINTPLTKPQWQSCYRAARKGRLPETLWTELYFQTAYDRSVAPEGRHAMSIFAQYVPYDLEGGWEDGRDRAGQLALQAVAEHCDDFWEVFESAQVAGPADIETEVGLTGGHIFQGSCLPETMWHNRLTARTPMAGFYLCGAATHPGGSVIGINGRNAAKVILQDRQASRTLIAVASRAASAEMRSS